MNDQTIGSYALDGTRPASGVRVLIDGQWPGTVLGDDHAHFSPHGADVVVILDDTPGPSTGPTPESVPLGRLDPAPPELEHTAHTRARYHDAIQAIARATAGTA